MWARMEADLKEMEMARSLFRRLMEIDPAYCDVIVQRYEKFTGRKAERVAAEEVAA